MVARAEAQPGRPPANGASSHKGLGEMLFRRFEPHSLLGGGSFGEVFECFDRETEQTMALKLLHRFEADALLRFKHEFRCLADIDHPNLVRIGELFEDDRGRWGFSMELVQGCDFLEWVRAGLPAGEFHEGRLRGALVQLARGLGALHSLGMLHRDIKPQNLRITPEGRLVLLDFGLVSNFDQPAENSDFITGSVAYMAPEQVDQHCSPASDLYAVGVLLYEIFTGQMPFEGSNLSVLLDKTRREAPPLSEACGAPKDLRELCQQLLLRDPDKRPAVPTILQALGERPTRISLSSLAPPPAAEPHGDGSFVGREASLRALDAQYAQVEDGQLRITLIEGPSGMGKTTLMEHWAHHTEGAHRQAVILRGRCHAAEQVRYKLWDGVVDALCSHLQSLDAEICRELLPEQAWLLVKLFPVLSKVTAMPVPPSREVAVEAPTERLAAFRAFGVLLHNLSRRTPLLCCIDDAQWADLDSLALLESLLSSARDARTLLVLTARPLEETDDAVPARIADLCHTHPAFSRITLSPLSRAECELLGARLMGLRPVDPEVKRLARESRGHPWFASEFARHLQETGEESRLAHADLEAALCDRAKQLGEQAHRLLELVAVAGEPVSTWVLRQAAELDGEPFERALRTLRGHKLIRLLGRGRWVCYHDRIGEAVRGNLSPAYRANLHAKLACGWHACQGDAARIARHWLAAGEPGQAVRWLRRAAHEAEYVGAYERAANLCRQALSADAASPSLPAEQHRALHLQLAENLDHAGRCAESARVLIAMLEEHEQLDRREIQVRAAEQLLRAGEVRAGLAACHDAFEALDLTWPRTHGGTMARLVWQRATGRLKKVPHNAPNRADSRAQTQLDALERLSHPMAFADMLRSAEMLSRQLRLARQVGSAQALARALLEECVVLSVQRPHSARAEQLYQHARSLVPHGDEPALDAFTDFIRGNMLVFRGDNVQALQYLERAVHTYETACPEEAWQVINARALLLLTRLNLGDFPWIRDHAERWHTEARLRGDAFATAMYAVTGMGCVRHLCSDEPERAHREIRNAITPFMDDGAHLGVQHFMQISVTQFIRCYEGGQQAWTEFESWWPDVRHSFLWRVPHLREVLWCQRGTGALHYAISDAPEGASRQALHESCKALARARTPTGRVWGALVRAQTLYLEGDQTGCRSLLESTAGPLEHMGDYFRRPVQVFQKYLQDQTQGREALSELFAWLDERGFINTTAAARLHVPALALF